MSSLSRGIAFVLKRSPARLSLSLCTSGRRFHAGLLRSLPVSAEKASLPFASILPSFESRDDADEDRSLPDVDEDHGQKQVRKRHGGIRSEPGGRHRIIEVPNAVVMAVIDLVAHGWTLPNLEAKVFALVDGLTVSPREALTLIAVNVQERPTTKKEISKRVTPALLKMAWNKGKDDAYPRAGYLLATFREDAEPAVSSEEADAIFEALLRLKFWGAYIGRAKRAIWEYDLCSKEDATRQEALRTLILTSLRAAMDNGILTAHMLMGDLYGKGQIVPRDAGKAETYWTAAAEHHHKAAARRLFRAYAGFDVVPPLPTSQPQALKFASIAASNYGDAATYVGQSYYHDRALPSYPDIEAHVRKWGVHPNDFIAANNFTHAYFRGGVMGTMKLAEMLVYDCAPIPMRYGGRTGWLRQRADDDKRTWRTRQLHFAYGLCHFLKNQSGLWHHIVPEQSVLRRIPALQKSLKEGGTGMLEDEPKQTT